VARKEDRNRLRPSSRPQAVVTAMCPNKEVAADACPRMSSSGHDLDSVGGGLHKQIKPADYLGHSPQSHSKSAGAHRVSVLPVKAELQLPWPQQQEQPTPHHKQEEQYRHLDELPSLCAPASHMHEQQSSLVVDIHLSQLLEEKRRLLRGVSARLGEKVVSSVLENALVGPAPGLEAYMEAAPHVACGGGGNFAGASLATHVIPSATVWHCAPEQRSLEPSPVAADHYNQGTACAELRSLCAGLRDSIGRKRALLDRLQSIT